MKLFSISLGFVTAIVASPAIASGAGYSCVPIAQFVDVVAGTDVVKINNFSIRERTSIMNEMSVIEIAFAVGNRRETPVYLNGQFAATDASGQPVVALSAGPMMDLIQPGATETAKGDVYVEPGTLKRIDKICVNIVGDF